MWSVKVLPNTRVLGSGFARYVWARCTGYSIIYEGLLSDGISWFANLIFSMAVWRTKEYKPWYNCYETKNFVHYSKRKKSVQEPLAQTEKLPRFAVAYGKALLFCWAEPVKLPKDLRERDIGRDRQKYRLPHYKNLCYNQLLSPLSSREVHYAKE